MCVFWNFWETIFLCTWIPATPSYVGDLLWKEVTLFVSKGVVAGLDWDVILQIMHIIGSSWPFHWKAETTSYMVHGNSLSFLILTANHIGSKSISTVRFSDSSYLRSIRIIRVARALRGVRVIRLIHYIGALGTLVHLCRIRKCLCVCVCVIALCSDNLRNLRDWLCLMLQV